MNYKKGKVTRVFKDGFVYIQEDETLKMFIVNSCNFLPKYRGQNPEELGLKEGTPVLFMEENLRITDCQFLLSPPNKIQKFILRLKHRLGL
jgi:hypothetical protein